MPNAQWYQMKQHLAGAKNNKSFGTGFGGINPMKKTAKKTVKKMSPDQIAKRKRSMMTNVAAKAMGRSY